MKNRCAYWGIAAALLGAHSLRSVPVTGTPFCNGAGDLASMISFINPRLKSAKTPWWKEVTSGSMHSEHIAKCCSEVTQSFFVRREKHAVLKDMVQKTVDRVIVRQFRAEQLSYEPYEASLLDVLKKFSQLSREGLPENSFELKQHFTNMMCLMSCMRAANIHAMLPGGREWTLQFSPTRRHLIRNESRPSVCVCCNRTMRPSIPVLQRSGNTPKRDKQAGSINASVEDFENGMDDDDVNDCDIDQEKLVPIPYPQCRSITGIRHYAHLICHEKMKQENTNCPRCLHSDHVFKLDFPGCARYCQNVDGGFPGSSKIDSVIRWQASVPKNDKVGSSIHIVSMDSSNLPCSLIICVIYRYLSFRSSKALWTS